MPPQKSELDLKNLKARSDGRRTLLVYMDPGLIKDLKKAALDEDRTVYEIVEEATRDWLGGRGGAGARVMAEEQNRRRSR
jgi:hypothetical protein